MLTFTLKMKFIFNIVGPAALPTAFLLLAAGGCTRPQVPPTISTQDGGDAQRLVTILDYVGSDYAMAVQNGQVVSTLEYEEQVKFTADARRLAASLLGNPAPSDPLLAML